MILDTFIYSAKSAINRLTFTRGYFYVNRHRTTHVNAKPIYGNRTVFFKVTR